MAIVSINRKVGRPKKEIEVHPEIDFSEWVQSIPKANYGEYTGENEVAVAFTGKKRLDPANTKAHAVTIKIGKAIIEKLGWKFGDKISIFNHKDDLMQFILIKRESGYKLKKAVRTQIGQIRYLWKNSFRLQVTKTHRVEFYIHQSGYLVFRANMTSPMNKELNNA